MYVSSDENILPLYWLQTLTKQSNRCLITSPAGYVFRNIKTKGSLLGCFQNCTKCFQNCTEWGWRVPICSSQSQKGSVVIGSERGSNRGQDEFRCRFDKLDFYLKTFERPENFVDLEKKWYELNWTDCARSINTRFTRSTTLFSSCEMSSKHIWSF